MRILLGRIASAVLAAGGWLLLGVKGALDLIGYSTVAEDAKVAAGLGEAFLAWVLAVPWWATIGFALVISTALIWASWPRQYANTPQPYSGSKSDSGHNQPKPKSWAKVSEPVVSIAHTELQYDNAYFLLRNIVLDRDGAISFALGIKDVENPRIDDYEGIRIATRDQVNGSNEFERLARLTPKMKSGTPIRIDIEIFDILTKNAPTSFKYKVNGTLANGSNMFYEGSGSLIGENARVFVLEVWTYPAEITGAYAIGAL